MQKRWGSPRRERGTDGLFVRVAGEAGGNHEMKCSLKCEVWAGALSFHELPGDTFSQGQWSSTATPLTTWAGTTGKAYRLKFGA